MTWPTGISIRHAARVARRAPGFSLGIILIIALSVGASVAIFDLVEGILISPLPYADADRLVWIGQSAPGWDLLDVPLSLGTYLYYKEHSRFIEDAGLYLESTATLIWAGEPERVRTVAVTPSLLSTLGVRPLIGRAFRPGEDVDWPPPTILLGHEYWSRRFGSDRSVVGRTIRLDGANREVIGVMPPGFGVPDPAVSIYTAMYAPPDQVRFGGFFRPAIARIRDGGTPAQLKLEMDSLLLAMPDVYDVTVELIEDAGIEAIVTPLKERVVGDIGQMLWLLATGVALMLFIACATASSLLLVRAESRSAEAEVRLALGASRAGLVLQLLAEALLLALVGGAVGLGVAQLVVASLVDSGVGLPRLHTVGLGLGEVAAGLLLSIATALLLGALPAIASAHLRPSRALGGQLLPTWTSLRRRRGRDLVVIAQMALTLPLLAGAALMAQTSWALSRIDPGFETGGVLTAQLVLPTGDYPSPAEVSQFYTSLTALLESTAGVETAAFTTALPLTPGIRSDPLWVDEVDPSPDDLPPFVTFKYVTPGYFEAMGIPLVEGDFVTTRNYDPSAMQVVVNAELARQLLSPGPALRRTVGVEMRGTMRRHTVAGVVGSVRDQSLRHGDEPILYFSLIRESLESMGVVPRSVSVVVRTQGDPRAFVGVLRGAIRGLDPDLAIEKILSLEAIVRDSVAAPYLLTKILILTALGSLFIGAVGIYSLIALAVGQRAGEIGVRVALGATGAGVRRMIVIEGARVALLGLALGGLAALWTSRLFDGLVYEISPFDLRPLAAAAIVVFAVALLGSYLPASRAAAADPAAALRK